MKDDSQKPPIHLIPVQPLKEMATVFGFGARKYGENNWRKDLGNTSWGRTYSSIQRHLLSFWDGEDIDPESGFTHLSHAATQMLILIEQYNNCKEMDDRYVNRK
jgi:hypothetical protein